MQAESTQLPLWPAEEWRPVVGWEGLYSISSIGRVRRDFSRSTGKAGAIIKPWVGKTGYISVSLYRDAIKTNYYVHALVAAAFIGPRPYRLDIDHIDSVKANNRVENLHYISRSENLIRADIIGPMRRGRRNPNAKLTDDAVRKIRASAEQGKILAVRYGVSSSLISRVKTKSIWEHVT